MAKIKLNNAEWHYDPKSTIGDVGGFGRVHNGTDISRNNPVAVKKLHLSSDDAGHRELDIAQELMNRQLTHVMPILDSGIDANTGRYFIVMPKADMSLENKLKTVGQFPELEAVEILLQIASGLKEVSDIVHRDLKPANILFHNGKWKIADFGIARFVERATSQNTVKEFLSPSYASPEQWRLEHSTNATDIYALGCIAYALLTGHPPFLGSREDCKASHLSREPHPLNETITPLLRSTISLMLRKASQVRPSISRILELLSKVNSPNANLAGFATLAKASADDAEKLLKIESEEKKRKDALETRERTATEAKKILLEILDFTINKILEHAPTATHTDDKSISGVFGRITGSPVRGINLGNAKLLVCPIPGTYQENAFPQSKWDVLCGAIIQVEQRKLRPYQWSANLWYTNLGKEADYRWYEVPYFSWGEGSVYLPQAITNVKHADYAASVIMSSYQHVVENPCPIDMESTDKFVERWAMILAKAYHGELQRPSSSVIHNYCSNEFLKS